MRGVAIGHVRKTVRGKIITHTLDYATLVFKTLQNQLADTIARFWPWQVCELREVGHFDTSLGKKSAPVEREPVDLAEVPIKNYNPLGLSVSASRLVHRECAVASLWRKQETEMN